MTPAAFKDAWAIFLMASGSMSVCLYSCGNESKASLFFPGGCFGTLQSARPDPCVHLVCLEWWPAAVRGRGERRKCSMRENMIPAAYLRIISVTTDVLKRCVAWECFLTRSLKTRNEEEWGRTGTERQNGRKAHVVMCNWGIGIADLQGILGMLRLKSLLFGVVSVRM